MSDTYNVEQTAEFLGISETRVKRLARESLLNNIGGDTETPIFNAGDVQRYKELAERIGGI